MSLATYIPESVQCLIGGILPVRGFVDGTFIEISKDVPAYTSVRTPDGTVSRLYNNDQTYTVLITLYSGSDSNDVLTKFWQIDEISQVGKFPLLIKDISGTDLFFSTSTWIETPAPIIKSNGFEGRTWVLRSSHAVINVGSNTEASGLVEDLTNIVIGALPTLEGII